jgi:hypothetical protein
MKKKGFDMVKKHFKRLILATGLLALLVSFSSSLAAPVTHAATAVYYPSSFHGRLSDGDIINVDPPQKGPDPTKAQLCLKLSHGVTWWKGIVLVKPDGSFSTIRDVQGIQDQFFCGLYSPSQAGQLYLSKAKEFGIHRNIYRIANARTAFQPGMSYNFDWADDNG